MKYVIVFLLLAFCTSLYIAGSVVNFYKISSGNNLREASLWESCSEDLTTAIRSCQSLDSLSTFTSCQELQDRVKAARAFTLLTSLFSVVTLVLSIVRIAADCSRRGVPRYALVFFQILTPFFGIIGFAATGSLYTIGFCGNAAIEDTTNSTLGASLPLYVVAVAFSFITVIVECCVRGRGERARSSDNNNESSGGNEEATKKNNDETKSKEPTS